MMLAPARRFRDGDEQDDGDGNNEDHVSGFLVVR